MTTTLILPGFSIKNKDWAEDVYKHLDLGSSGEVINWRHWNTHNNEDFHFQREAEHIEHKIINKSYNIISKSIGTLVAMEVIAHSPALLQKLILCGIPFNDLSEDDLVHYKILHDIHPGKVICFQNSEDPHGNSLQAREFLKNIHEGIKVVEMQSDTHDYPYFKEFGRILGN